MRYVTVVGIVLLGLLTTGCNEDKQVLDPFPEGMEKVWAKMFAPYGLYPLFPVRTGVQPGDVVVLCKRPWPIGVDVPGANVSAQRNATAQPSTELEKKNSEAEGYEWRFLFSLDGIQQALEWHAKSRMAYLSFQAPSAKTSPDLLGPVVGTKPYEVGVVGTSVGLASFPAVLSYTERRTDVGASLPVGTAAPAVGSSRRAFSSYILEVPAAEFVDLPYALLQQALEQTVKSPSPAIKVSLSRLNDAFKGNTCLSQSLSVVGAAFYSRNIIVSMGDSYANALSARAAYQLPADSTRKKVYDALSAYAAGANAPGTPAASSPPGGSAPSDENNRFEKLILDINDAYQGADDNSKLEFAGVRFGFSEAAGKGISMDYKYAVPVAFGVRMYALKLDSNSVALSHELPLSSSRSADGSTVVPYESESGFGDCPPPPDDINCDR